MKGNRFIVLKGDATFQIVWGSIVLPALDLTLRSLPSLPKGSFRSMNGMKGEAICADDMSQCISTPVEP